MNTKKRIIIAFILIILVLIVNQLGATGAINQMSQKDVSDKYPTLITPEPIAFTIWIVIYGMLLLVLIMAFINNEKPWAITMMKNISIPFYLSSIINILWILTFSYELLGFGSILTLVYSICIAILCKKLNENRKENLTIPGIAFGLYEGWLLIATVLNVSAWLVKIKWDLFGISENYWAIIILVVAFLLTFIVSWNLKNAAVPISAAWAYLNIFLKHKSFEGFSHMYPLIEWTALVGAMGLLVIAIFILVKNRGVLPKVYN